MEQPLPAPHSAKCPCEDCEKKPRQYPPPDVSLLAELEQQMAALKMEEERRKTVPFIAVKRHVPGQDSDTLTFTRCMARNCKNPPAWVYTAQNGKITCSCELHKETQLELFEYKSRCVVTIRDDKEVLEEGNKVSNDSLARLVPGVNDNAHVKSGLTDEVLVQLATEMKEKAKPVVNPPASPVVFMPPQPLQ